MKNIFYDKSKIDYGNLLFPRRALWMLLIPLIIEQMLNSLMGMVDTLMVSRVGAEAISAVSLVDSINNLVLQVFAAMAAGAAVSMLGGTPQQVGTAVAVVFKNVLGLVCDPVAGLVEVPCIKRNGACALQALLAAELALAGISSFINADEAIDAMKSVGDALPCALKETAGGGMAATPSAIEWAAKYFARK